MNEIIKIKCPFDGAVLSVRYQEGIEKKNLTCPICKNKYPFTQFKRLGAFTDGDDSGTEYPDKGRNDDTDLGKLSEKTTIGPSEENVVVGKVTVCGTSKSFQLRPGRNVIGRKGTTSRADFQVDTGEKRSMSREHLVIEVRKVAGKGFVHYASLFKEQVNETFIGNEQLYYGDCVILKHGAMIKLPDAILKFEIPDNEGTVM